MRLFLLPISTKRSLLYCQRLNNQGSSEITFIDKLTTRASAIWLKWEKSERDWQKKVTAYGNKLFERIPHEEWGLKSVPPLSKRREDEELKGQKEVKVVFPGSVISEKGVKEALKAFSGQERQGFHTKWIIPNLPFFYLVFRAWSHWKARSGSRHLDFLLDRRFFQFATSPALELAYRVGRLDTSMKEIDSDAESILYKSPRSPGPKADASGERMLLTQSNGKTIADLMGVPELEEQIQRAVKQVGRALSAKNELQEEKEEIYKVNKEADPKR
ncbi:MAG: hypothetical protein Q9179_004351 [Wetmoreana sp. 5 TL-2023]